MNSLFLSLIVIILFNSQALAINAMDECLVSVEAYDDILAEEWIHEQDRLPLHIALTNALTACEAGNFAQAEPELMEANRHYNQLVEKNIQFLSDGEFWQRADWYWGHRSYRKGVRMLRTHLNEDAVTDIVGWRVNLDSPDQDSFDLLMVTKQADGKVQWGAVSLPYDTTQQFALCHPAGEFPEPEVRHYEWREEVLNETFAQPMHEHSIRIDDGMCDSIYAFWPGIVDRGAEEVTLELFRH